MALRFDNNIHASPDVQNSQDESGKNTQSQNDLKIRSHSIKRSTAFQKRPNDSASWWANRSRKMPSVRCERRDGGVSRGISRDNLCLAPSRSWFCLAGTSEFNQRARGTWRHAARPSVQRDTVPLSLAFSPLIRSHYPFVAFTSKRDVFIFWVARESAPGEVLEMRRVSTKDNGIVS